MAEPLTQAKEDQLQVLEDFLKQYGLGDLVTDARTWITNGYTEERIDLEMRKTNTFKQAFPEIAKLQELGKEAVSVQSVIDYRKEVKNTLMNAGLPPGFYDSPDDFVDLLAVKDLSALEIKTRVEQGYARVAGAPQEVKDVFNSFFGASGENALATFFLDPTKGRDLLLQQVTQAEISGAGKRFGFDIDQGFAERLREVGVNADVAAQGFDQVGQMSFGNESINETADISDTELIEAGFGVNKDSKAKVARRQQERAAASGGQGGAAQGQEGFGLGTAR